MATPERILQACRMLLEEHDRGDTNIVACVSAIGNCDTFPVKVTDVLLNSIAQAEQARDGSYQDELDKVLARYEHTAKEILGERPDLLDEYLASLIEEYGALKAMLEAISCVGTATATMSDFVVGHGELWNAKLMTYAFRLLGAEGAAMLDARDILVVSPSSDGSVDVHWDESSQKFELWKQEHLPGGSRGPIVMTGFIARSRNGRPTTLKRNGSDYSATIIGALLAPFCKHITIWTDVDGVFSADPRKVKTAVPLTSLAYEEAWEMSYFGASVLHPRSTMPAMKHSIPVSLRNFFQLDHPGTTIGPKPPVESGVKYSMSALVKGFATIDSCSIINIEGTGMVGVPGTASRIFSKMRDAGINVIMISQGSSEHSVCFAVDSAVADRAVQVLRLTFQDYIQKRTIAAIDSINDCSILAAVGSQMTGIKGISARLFMALAEADINVRATAQGCSEHNISVVIDRKDKDRALQVVHEKFYKQRKTLKVGIVSSNGKVDRVIAALPSLASTMSIAQDVDMEVRCVAKGDKMRVLENCIEHSWSSTLLPQDVPFGASEFEALMAEGEASGTVLIHDGSEYGELVERMGRAGAALLPADFVLTLCAGPEGEGKGEGA